MNQKKFDRLLDRAGAARASGNFLTAVKLYEVLLRERPSDSGLWNDIGIALDGLGRTDEAIKAYEKSIELDPESHHAYANLATVAMHRGEYDRALQLYDRALVSDPQLLPALYNRSMIFGLRGDYHEMLAGLDRVLALKEDHYMALTARWEALMKLGREADAVESLEKAIRLNPEYVNMYTACMLNGTALHWNSGMTHGPGHRVRSSQ